MVDAFAVDPVIANNWSPAALAPPRWLLLTPKKPRR
jgi:hypothetical protein